MPFDHACFISYRHEQGELIDRAVRDLFAALKNELPVALIHLTTRVLDFRP